MIQMSSNKFQVYDSEIEEAKEIRLKEDEIPGEQVFDSPNRWVGKIGEWAIENSEPNLIPITANYKAIRIDFKGKHTGYIYEVKTKYSEKWEFRNNYCFDLNLKQFNRSKAKVYIACYFCNKTKILEVVGWMYKDEIPKYGKILKAGDKYENSEYTVRATKWEVEYSHFQPMDKLPDNL